VWPTEVSLERCAVSIIYCSWQDAQFTISLSNKFATITLQQFSCRLTNKSHYFERYSSITEEYQNFYCVKDVQVNLSSKFVKSEKLLPLDLRVWQFHRSVFRRSSRRSFFLFWFVRLLALRPLLCLLCQPRVIVKMIVEKQMECRLAGKTEVVSEKTYPSATFVHHKLQNDTARF
jgi:hypothetical protein